MARAAMYRSEEHTSELQSLRHLVCRLLLEKKTKRPIAAPPCARSHSGHHHITRDTRRARPPHSTLHVHRTPYYGSLPRFSVCFFLNIGPPPRFPPFPHPPPFPS